jgi:hypothetical protein
MKFATQISPLLNYVLVGGHDSAEDALTCLDLMKMKVKLDIKKMITLNKKQQK